MHASPLILLAPDAMAPASSPPDPSSPESDSPELSNGETLTQIIIRRSRYVIAILISAALFLWLAWPLVAPPPQWTGLSLLAWHPVPQALLGAVVILILLVAATAISMFVIHPDSPHTGLFCACIGMAALSIRGDGIDLLLQYAMLADPPAVASLYRSLAVESLLLALVLFCAELANRFLFTNYFATTAWLTRHGLPAHGLKHVPDLARLSGHAGTPARLSARLPAECGSFVLATALAMIFASVFMQSQAKGQVLFACFVSFGFSSFLANLAFADSSSWPILLAVPCAAAVGYFRANTAYFYPDHALSPMARALPIDYLCAGVPGAIVGYYSSVRLRIHNIEEEKNTKAK